MAIVRDTKARARRIDLAYFRRRSPFRLAKLLLSIGVPLAALGWVVAMAARGDERIYTSGPVSTRHAMIETRCDACHTTEWGMRYTDPAGWQEALDVACLKCHDGPVHHAGAGPDVRGVAPNLTAARCSRCHVEHEGAGRLARVGDRTCVECHGRLEAVPGGDHPAACLVGKDHAIASGIRSFSDGHPDFAAVAKGAKDPSVSKFNHAVHLHPDTDAKRELIAKQLEDLAGRPGIGANADGVRTLECAYCHAPSGAGAYIAPVHYESHCRDCHPVKVEDQPVPHEAPDAIRAFLVRRAVRNETPVDEIQDAVMEAEVPLFESDPDGCMKCHTTELGDEFPEAAPLVARTGLRTGPPGRTDEPRRWFIHSFFDHSTHRELACLECHGGARTSTLTSDLLMPSRQLCARCHSPSGGVASSCVTCHTYHHAREGAPRGGGLRIGEILK